jgi:hypothetical protein
VPNARVREFAKEVVEVLFNSAPVAPQSNSLAAQVGPGWWVAAVLCGLGLCSSISIDVGGWSDGDLGREHGGEVMWVC